jgi:hypothetical protein
MRESPTIMMEIENGDSALQSDVAFNEKGQENRASRVAEDDPRRKGATRRRRKALAKTEG